MNPSTEANLTFNDGRCMCCGGMLAKTVLEHNRPDRFEVASGISDKGYVRYWVECQSCGAATNIQRDACLEKLQSLSASYYEVDYQGSDIASKYQWVMNLPEAESDNAGRAHRVNDLFTQWRCRNSCRHQFRMLDIGAGTGVFLSKFLSVSNSHWSAVAVEPDPTAADHLRSLDAFDVEERLFEAGQHVGSFDLITLNKVLEHIATPAELLESVFMSLKPESGAVYVEVPDVKTINFRPLEDNILGALHCHLYTPKALEALFEKAGLVSVQIARVIDPSGKMTVYGYALRPEAYALRAGS